MQDPMRDPRRSLLGSPPPPVLADISTAPLSVPPTHVLRCITVLEGKHEYHIHAPCSRSTFGVAIFGMQAFRGLIAYGLGADGASASEPGREDASDRLHAIGRRVLDLIHRVDDRLFDKVVGHLVDDRGNALEER